MGHSFNNTLIQFQPNDAFNTKADGATWAIWLRTTQTSGNTGIVSYWAGNSRGGPAILLNNTAGNVGMFFGGGLDGGVNCLGGGMNDGNWHHFAATFDRTGASNNIKVYKDGVYSNQGTSTANWGQGGQTMNIGAVADGFWARYVGDLAEFAIWDRKLSADEILALALGSPAGYISPQDLELYVPMLD